MTTATFFGAGTAASSSSSSFGGRALDEKTLRSRLGRCGTTTRRRRRRRRHHSCRVVTDSFAMFSNSRNDDVSREKSDEEETVYRLRFTGNDAGMEVPAISLRKGDAWTVGRVKKRFSMDAKNFIELKVPSVSTRHAQVSRDMNGNVYVTDLKSKNGTYVNGIEIYKKTKIILRDDVVFGDATFRLEDATSRNPLSAVSSGAKKLFKSRNVSELDAQTESRAKVKKQEYMFAGLKLKAPPKTPGRQIADWEMEASGLGSMAWMDTTFVDNDLRISRTQAGAVFVFSRNDPNDDDVTNY